MTLMASFYELVKANSMKSWSLQGKNRLVKVVTFERAYVEHVGYVTQEKYLCGLTPLQIERDLGLKPKMLQTGARIYALQRLPDVEEFDCKLSTSFPGGSIFSWDDVSEDQFKRRDFWPPGKGFPQWDVTASIPTTLIRSLLPYEPY